MKRLLCLLLAGLLLCAALAGCRRDDAPGEESGTDTGTAGPAPVLYVSALADYAVIRPSGAGSGLVEATLEFISTLNGLYNLSITPKDDFVNPAAAPGECEIIIGSADRDEVRAFLADMRINDWGYGMVGKKLIIAGQTEAGTLRALEEFSSRYLAEAAAEVFFDSADSVVTPADYQLDSILLDGRELRDYSLVYPARYKLDEKALAELLRDTLTECYGYVLPVVADSDYTGEYAVFIGQTSQITEDMLQARNQQLPAGSEEKLYYIAQDGANIWIDGENNAALQGGVKAFGAGLRPDEEGGRLCTLEVGAGKTEAYAGTSVSSMSFNVYYQFDTTRANRVLTLIKNYQPDTFGLQEATPQWMTFLRAQLGSVYGDVGEGRNGGSNGEANPVFYKKDKFTLVESDTLWLSPLPEAAGTTFPGAGLPRVMTYALLECKETGEQVMHINTHLGIEGDEMRAKQLGVLLELVATELPQQVPFVVTGDFNWPNTATLEAEMQTIGCVNSSTVAASVQGGPTFGTEQVIDYLFISELGTGVDSYRVCNEKIDGEYPSDHYPVYVEWYTILQQ